ncbi:MAG: DUF4363 family protein [Vallitalea sp.]|nr:DUF4363 family protein [Vallitalea sp.]
MKKIMTFIITSLVLIVFIFIMNSGGFMKQSFSDSDNVPALLAKLEKDIIQNNWKQALIDIDDVESAWKEVEKRVQFSIERNDIEGISLSIARLKGSIRGENKSECFIGWQELNGYWDNLEN